MTGFPLGDHVDPNGRNETILCSAFHLILTSTVETTLLEIRIYRYVIKITIQYNLNQAVFCGFCSTIELLFCGLQSYRFRDTAHASPMLTYGNHLFCNRMFL